MNKAVLHLPMFVDDITYSLGWVFAHADSGWTGTSYCNQLHRHEIDDQ